MKKFYCNGKKGFCNEVRPTSGDCAVCEHKNNTGGEYRMTPQEALNLLNDTEFAEKHQGKQEYTDMLLMCKEALEKQIPKKPIKKNPICYEKTKDGTEFIAYDYFCPDCNKQIKATEHHCKCGQALDWSDTKWQTSRL